MFILEGLSSRIYFPTVVSDSCQKIKFSVTLSIDFLVYKSIQSKALRKKKQQQWFDVLCLT